MPKSGWHSSSAVGQGSKVKRRVRPPEEHDNTLQRIGALLVAALAQLGVGWQWVVLTFEVPLHTGKIKLTDLSVRLDDPLQVGRLTKQAFESVINALQRFHDNSGPEPWQKGTYRLFRNEEGQIMGESELE